MTLKRLGYTGVFVSLVCAGLAWPAVAHAQSSGSFPEPAAPKPAAPLPPAYTPPPPAYTPPPPAYTPPAPVYTPPSAAPVASQPAAPAPSAPQLPTYQPPASSGVPSLPPLLPYKHGLPVPPGYRVVQRSANGLTLGGGLTFLAAYAAGLGLAASQSFGDGTAYTAIPVVGPFAAIGGRSFSCKVPITLNPQNGKDVQRELNKCVGQAVDEVTTTVFLTVDGLIQATGAVLFFVGLGSGYEELVREDLPKTAISVSPGGFSLSVSGAF